MPAATKKELAFELFGQGKRPSSPEVKELGLGKNSAYVYFQEYKKNHGGAPSQPPPRSTKQVPATPSAQLGEAVRVTVTPKSFTTSSSMLWQAMQVAINEWGWPADMTPDHFLDAYLYISMKQRGVILGGYTIIREEEDDDGSRGG